jgi:allantoate deiminase
MNITNTNRAERVIARCREIATYTDVPGETARLFLSSSTRLVHALTRTWMEAANMAVHIDAIGNLRGLWPASSPSAPRLLIGSHLDTVPNAGAFDGILGVILGIAVIEELQGDHLPFAIEVIGFSEEEGVRFSKPFLGSLVLVGKLDEETLARTDRDGITLSEAIRSFGLNPADLPTAIASQEAFAYLEFHIEQGPVLETQTTSLGVVEALVGQSRLQLTFTGQANHAGTTPMPLRHDAIAAAAEWIVQVEDYAKANSALVATVGKIQASPNAGNVIASRVTASLDVRHADDNLRRTAVTYLQNSAGASATKRGVSLKVETQLEQAAVPMDPHLTDLLQTAAQKAGYPSQKMTSGAGHDAMIVAQRIPAIMLFLRSPGGLSHHPDESVLTQDVEAALATAMEFLSLLRDDRANPTEPHA